LKIKPKMIGIIIVSYNSKEYLSDCLDSIFDSTYHKFKIYLVDNASADGSCKFVKSKFPKVEVIESGGNLGFAAGNNIGIKKALSDSCNFVFLLNPDTIIQKDCLEKLLNNHTDKTILQPLILIHENGKKTSLVNTTGNYLNFLGVSYCDDYRKNQSEISGKEITSASGAALFTSSSAFKEIGYLDDNFFMYHEDLDFCIRARLRNYSIKVMPDAIVWHKYHYSRNMHKILYVERNRLLFLYKNFPVKYLVLIFPLMLVNEILISLYFLSQKSLGIKVKSYIEAVKLLGCIKKSRKRNLVYFKNFGNVKKFIGATMSFEEAKSIIFYPYNVILSAYWFLIKRLI